MAGLAVMIDRVPVLADAGTVRLDEARHYEVHAGSDDEVWLDARRLPTQVPGQFALAIGYWVSPRPLVLRRVSRGAEVERVAVVVVPRSEKLSEASFCALLTDLEAWLPGVSVGTEGGRHGSVGVAGVAAPLVAEALTPLVPGLLAALAAVEAHPRRATVGVFDVEPLRRARKADREAIRWAMRHPDVVTALDAWRDAERVGPEAQILQSRAEDRLDHPVNRYAAWLIGRVVATLRRAADELAQQGRADADPDSAEWCRSRADHAARCADAVERALARSFLGDIPPAPASEAALLVLADEPAYGRLHHLGRRFVSPLFALDGPAREAASGRPTYDLYELWCLLAVQRALAAAHPGVRWRSRGLAELLSLTGTGAGAEFIGVGEGCTWRIEFNPTFASWFARNGRPRWSLSGERRPDIVVTRWTPTGARWASLDAKWRVGRSSLAEGFAESVHVYRDALRDDSAGGRCAGAALLCPARTSETADWFAASFRDEHACGAFALAPGLPDDGALAGWLTAILLPRA